MLQQETPEDFVIATGEQHSVREFVTLAGAHLGYDIEWRGAGLEEQGIDRKTGKVLVQVDPRYFRPTEVQSLLGDATKARTRLGWQPEVDFATLVKEMVEADLDGARRVAHLRKQGFNVPDHHE
jgi:GDPmannose 4,6-dehydratase